MAAKNSDYTKLLNAQHLNQWVALTDDRSKLLGADKDLKALTEKFGKKDIFYTRVLDTTTLYAY